MTDSSLVLLTRGAADFGLALNSAQLDHFDRYLTELEKWNRQMNLTGAHSRQEIVERHLVDSLAGALALREIGAATVADLGSGAGFPGLPLKIAFPSFDMTLIEPRQKRAAFLLHMCGTLGLSNLRVLDHTVNPTRRTEDHTAGRFDWVLLRAVADPSTAVGLAKPLLRPSGRIVVWVSEQQAAEAPADSEILRYRIGEAGHHSALLVI